MIFQRVEQMQSLSYLRRAKGIRNLRKRRTVASCYHGIATALEVLGNILCAFGTYLIMLYWLKFGAMSESASATSANGNGSSEHDVDRPMAVKRPRPTLLNGSTYRKETPLGHAYITVNSDENDEPFEVFLNVGKAGSDVSAVSEGMGRLISLVLRMPANLPPSERLRWVMDEMAGIGGGRPMGFGANRVRSLPDGVAQVLAEHLSELPIPTDEPRAEQLALPIAKRPIGDICPECGEAAFLNIEGCRKCHVCSYSEC